MPERSAFEAILVHVQNVRFEDSREHGHVVYDAHGRHIGRSVQASDHFITVEMKMIVARSDAPKFFNHVATFYLLDDAPRCHAHEGCIRSREVGQACYAAKLSEAMSNPDYDLDDKAQDTVQVLKGTKRIE